jgi:hypothetical protein
MDFDWQTLGYDESWLEVAAQLEQESGWDGEVGTWLAQRQRTPAIAIDEVQTMIRTMRLQVILFTELQAWMSSWNLGVAFEATLTCARQRVRLHLAEPTASQQAYFEALLAESAEKTVQQPIRAQVIDHLKTMLTAQDWQAIAQAAAESMQARVMAIESSQVA